MKMGVAYLEADYPYPNGMIKVFVLQRASVARLC